MLTTIIALLLTIAVFILPLVIIYNWLKFEPLQNKLYVLALLNKHLFTIHVGNPLKKWYEKLAVYLIFWPFRIVRFGYSWTQEYTYKAAMEKIAKENAKEGRKAELYWMPELKDDAYDENGEPKNKNIKVIIKRTEEMTFLNEIEHWYFAAEFETNDNYRGRRRFKITFQIFDLSSTISKMQSGGWQEIAAKLFSAKFLARTKNQNYEEFRKTEMQDFLQNFIYEVNQIILGQGLGFKVSIIAPGDIVFHPDTQDLIDSLEAKEKAENEKAAEEVKAVTAKIKAKGEADAKKEKADGEAYAIKKIGQAKGMAKKAELGPVKDFINDTTKNLVEQNKSIVGDSGLGGIKTLVLDKIPGFNTSQYVSTLTAIEDSAKTGGNDDK